MKILPKSTIVIEVQGFPNDSPLADETRLSSWIQSNPPEFKLTKEGVFCPWSVGRGVTPEFPSFLKQKVGQGQCPLGGAAALGSACILPSERFLNLPAMSPAPKLWILAHWNWCNKEKS